MGVEKIAIYATGKVVRHIAWQQEDGTWKSKLGSDEDITHSLDGLAGPKYGQVIAFLKGHEPALTSLVDLLPKTWSRCYESL